MDGGRPNCPTRLPRRWPAPPRSSKPSRTELPGRNHLLCGGKYCPKARKGANAHWFSADFHRQRLASCLGACENAATRRQCPQQPSGAVPRRSKRTRHPHCLSHHSDQGRSCAGAAADLRQAFDRLAADFAAPPQKPCEEHGSSKSATFNSASTPAGGLRRAFNAFHKDAPPPRTGSTRSWGKHSRRCSSSRTKPSWAYRYSSSSHSSHNSRGSRNGHSHSRSREATAHKPASISSPPNLRARSPT